MDCALQYPDLFAVNPMERGEVQEVTHVVDTGEEPPIRQMPRRVPFTLRKEISNMVKDMLAAEVIQESSSPLGKPSRSGKEKGPDPSVFCGLPPTEFCHTQRCVPTATDR